MKLPRRKFLRLVAGAAALPAIPRVASAALDYPTRPVHWIVGFPPGGGADIVARIMGAWLTPRLGQQVIVENRPGAGTNIATEVVVRTAADGYTEQKLLSEPGFRAGAAPRPRLMPPKRISPDHCGPHGRTVMKATRSLRVARGLALAEAGQH